MTRRKDVTRQVAALLSTYGVKQPPVDVRAIAESQGITVVFEEMEDSVSGFLIQRSDAIVIGVNASHHPNRQRFTLAHELAHHHLHPGTPTVYIDNTMLHFRGEDIYESPDPNEIEANSFAAALLMPEEFLKSDVAGRRMDIADEQAVRALARRYEISPQALTIRLLELGLIAGLRAARLSKANSRSE